MGDLSGKKDSSTSSKSTTSTVNNNLDRRQVVAEGAFGFASDGANIVVNNSVLDGGAMSAGVGAINAGAGIANAAINSITAASATNGEGFDLLLGLADKLFTGAGQLVGKSQDTALAQLATINTAANDKTGAIDQKTIMVAVGVAGAVAIAFAVGGKK